MNKMPVIDSLKSNIFFIYDVMNRNLRLDKLGAQVIILMQSSELLITLF